MYLLACFSVTLCDGSVATLSFFGDCCGLRAIPALLSSSSAPVSVLQLLYSLLGLLSVSTTEPYLPLGSFPTASSYPHLQPPPAALLGMGNVNFALVYDVFKVRIQLGPLAMRKEDHFWLPRGTFCICGFSGCGVAELSLLAAVQAEMSVGVQNHRWYSPHLDVVP